MQTANLTSRLQASTGTRCNAHLIVARAQQGSLATARRGNSLVTAAVKDVFMPALSSTMTEGKIVTWLKQVGDKVKKGEPMVVVESDKADMDVESFSEGILAAIVVQEGERANVGASIAYVAESEADLEEARKKAGGAAPAAAATPAPAKPEVASPPPPPKAPEPAAPPKPAAVAPPPPPAAAPVVQPRADGRIVATPYAKQLAKELKVELASVAGTGPNGRITASDVERVANGKSAAPAAAAAAPKPAAPIAVAPVAPAAAPAPAAVKGTTVSELRGTTKPFTSLQNAVSRNMLDSLKVPEFRVAYQIETDKLDALYQRLKPSGVTMTALLAKACGLALAKHPLIFAVCTPDGAGITYNTNVNVAVAVAMPDGGLITPVVKDADTTDIYQISRNWADLVKRARSKQLKPDEFTTGNFAISNLGMYGVECFDAIIPPGMTAIIAIGASKPTVVVNSDGMFGIRKVMTVNLTADHRVVYGADAAEFLQTLKTVVENPDQLLY